MNYQKVIEQHNSKLYEAIQGTIHEMPDFRSSETVNKMKKVKNNGKWMTESQNNWRVLADELDAISYREDHMAVLNAFNKDQPIDINNYDCLREFVISYPGLLWVLWTISDAPLPLLISQWKNLPEALSSLLEKVTMKTEYIAYIRDLEIVDRFHNISSLVDESILDKLIKEEKSSDLIGWAYWIMGTDIFPRKTLTFCVQAMARIGDMRLFNVYNDYRKKINMGLSSFLRIIIEEGFDEALMNILQEHNEDFDYRYYLSTSIICGNIKTTQIILEYFPKPIDDRLITEMLNNTLYTRNLTMIKFLFNYSIFPSYTQHLKFRDIMPLIEEGQKEILKELLSFNISEKLWNEAKDLAISKGRGSIVKMISDHKNVMINDSDVMSSLLNNNMEALQVILNSPNYTCGIESINALRIAILGSNKPFIRFLLNHPKILKEKLEKRYLRMAEDLLKE